MPPFAQMTLCSTPGRMNSTSPVISSPALMTETDPRLPAITPGAGLQWGARYSTGTENTLAGNGRPAFDIGILIVRTFVQRKRDRPSVYIMEQNGEVLK